MDKLSFKALRAEHDLNQDDVAKALNITRQSYRNKESGRTEFTFAELLVLADLYSVSIETFKHPTL